MNVMQRKSLSFKILKVDNYSIDCEIAIGDWSLKFSFDDYGNDLEDIRHALESACYDFPHEYRPKTIDFEFECSPNLFTIQADVNGGCHVTIQSNAPFGEKSTFYCDKKQFIGEVYEGLLSAAIFWENFKFNSERLKDKAGAIYYNKLKSPLIEAYLNGWQADEFTVAVRQVVVDHILFVSPDFDYIFIKETGCCDGIYDDNVEIDDDDETVINLPGIYDWWMRYVAATDFADTTTDPSFDYDQWHKEGLAFASTLRAQLPDNYDLWYGYPYEDEARRHWRPILITKNYVSALKI